MRFLFEAQLYLRNFQLTSSLEAKRLNMKSAKIIVLIFIQFSFCNKVCGKVTVNKENNDKIVRFIGDVMSDYNSKSTHPNDIAFFSLFLKPTKKYDGMISEMITTVAKQNSVLNGIGKFDYKAKVFEKFKGKADFIVIISDVNRPVSLI